MPDLFTHVLVGATIAILTNSHRDKEKLTMLLIGSILIDAERPFTWLLEFMGYGTYSLTAGFHSILGACLLSMAAALLFDETKLKRKEIFGYLIVGAASHLLMDMTMGPWDEQGLYLLFPLKIPFSFHLFWSDFMFYPVIGMGLLLFAIIIYWLRFSQLPFRERGLIES